MIFVTERRGLTTRGFDQFVRRHGELLPPAFFYCLIRVGRVRKIRDRKQRKDIGKYSFINRTIKNWNQLAAEAFGTFPCKPKIFRNRVGGGSDCKRGEVKGIEVWRRSSESEVK